METTDGLDLCVQVKPLLQVPGRRRRCRPRRHEPRRSRRCRKALEDQELEQNDAEAAAG